MKYLRKCTVRDGQEIKTHLKQDSFFCHHESVRTYDRCVLHFEQYLTVPGVYVHRIISNRNVYQKLIVAACSSCL